MRVISKPTLARWRQVVWGIALVAVLSLGQSPTHAQGVIVDAGLMNDAQTNGTIPVIVTLDTNFTPMGALTEARAITQQDRIAARQTEVVQQLSSTNARVRYQYNYVPQLAMQVDAAALERLQNTRGVIRIEEDRQIGLALDSSVPVINGDTVRNLGYGGAGWAVAIIDTGVQNDHPWFGGRVVAEACFNSDLAFNATPRCPNGEETMIGTGAANDDCIGCGHGTHVAGIAAGHDPNGVHIGVAPQADIIGINVFSNKVNGGITSYISDINAALEHVYDLRDTHNIAAVNMSLGGSLHSSYCDNVSTKYYVDLLRSAKIATVISSGNGFSSTQIAFPSCISTAVAVGNTYDNDTVRGSSNVNDMMDLYAPGTDIISALPGSSSGIKTGTSMSAPHVAGAWAVLKQVEPNADVTTVLNTLTTTGVPITARGIVKPRIDVLAAAKEIQTLIPPDNVQANTIRLNSAQLSWRDANFYVDAYRLYVDGTVTSDLSAETTQTTVGDLACDGSYSVQIAAKYGDTEVVSTPINVQTASCSIDVNGDGYITPADAVYVANNIGTSDLYADVNNDLQVTEADLNIVIDYLGQTR